MTEQTEGLAADLLVRRGHSSADPMGRSVSRAPREHGSDHGNLPHGQEPAHRALGRSDPRGVHVALFPRRAILRTRDALGANPHAGVGREPRCVEGQQLQPLDARCAERAGPPARLAHGLRVGRHETRHPINPCVPEARCAPAAGILDLEPNPLHGSSRPSMWCGRSGAITSKCFDSPVRASNPRMIRELNNWHERLAIAWRNIASPNVALWTHVIRRRERSYPEGLFEPGFASELNEHYKARIERRAIDGQ